MIGIYKITEKQNLEMFYIGQSVDIERWLKEHQYKKYEQSKIPFDGYIDEKGRDAFLYEVLEECPAEKLNEREYFWIKTLNAQKFGNVVSGGNSHLDGENNPNSKLTKDEIIYIRTAYANHEKQKEVYEKFKDKISFNYFQNVWQGRSWSNVMPEVFIKENQEYYVKEACKGEKGSSAKFSNEEVILIRKRYVMESAKQIFDDYKDRISYQTLQQILWGRAYSSLPIYKKKERKWINV